MSVIAMGISGGGLSNGSLINGVAHFVTDTKPTTRIDSSALVAGDRWYNSTDGTEWFWNGTYWLENVLYTAAGSGSTIISDSPGIRLYTIDAYSATNLKGAIFVESVAVISTPGQYINFGDASNYRTFRFSFWHQGGFNILIHETPPSYTLSNTGYSQEINTVYYPNGFQTGLTTVGSVTNYTPLLVFYYRNFYPL